MTRRKGQTKYKQEKYLALIIGGLLCLLIVAPTLLSGYSSGWEISTNFRSVKMDDKILALGGSATGFIDNTYVNTKGGYVKLADGKPEAIYGNVFPHYIQANYDASYVLRPDLFGSCRVSIDVDAPYPVTRAAYGLPWYKSVDGSPYETYEKTVGDTTWFFDHYVYFFAVDIETDGKAEVVGSFVYGTCEGLPSIVPMDHELDVRVFSDFKLKPWSVEDGQIYPVGNYSVQTTDVFYGIMSASVAELELGDTGESVKDVEDLDSINLEYEGKIDPHKDHVGAALAMYVGEVDYTGYEGVLGADAEEIVKAMPNTIPKEVTIETGVTLEAGLVVDGTATWNAWAVVNKYVRYIVRVDAVYTAGLVLLAGDQDPPEEKEEKQYLDDLDTLWDEITEELYGLFKQYEILIYLVLIAIAAVIGLYIFMQVKPFLMAGKRFVGR